MAEVEATKFYVRHREGYPETEVQEYARRGFWTLGVETAIFEWVDDVDALEDLGPTVGIAGWIGDVHAGLKRLGKPIPPNVDYPEELTDFLGRKIWTGTLAEVRASTQPLFVKPVAHKAFTGFVWTNDRESRMRVVTHADECPVFIAEPIDLVAEYRSMILHGKVIDCRRYKGDWSVAPNKDVVESAVKAMDRPAPHAYCLDWGITADGKTVLVEANEGYSFGHYGMHPVSYARMLSARWHEMTS